MAGPDFKNGYKKGFEDGANSVEEGLPGWFGTFADMMTLLFAFFVLLAAISTMDPVKLQEMANSEGKSLGSKIKASGKAEEEGEFEDVRKSRCLGRGFLVGADSAGGSLRRKTVGVVGVLVGFGSGLGSHFIEAFDVELLVDGLHEFPFCATALDTFAVEFGKSGLVVLFLVRVLPTGHVLYRKRFLFLFVCNNYTFYAKKDDKEETNTFFGDDFVKMKRITIQ